MEPTIWDVCGAILLEDGAILGLFDPRYNAVKIVKPYVVEIRDEKENVIGHEARLSASDPDGAERLYWLEKFGMITEEEFQEESAKITDKSGKKKLYELLKKEFE